MPPKQPSYLDLLKETATSLITDPTYTIPLGAAGATAAINYGVKKLGPDLVSKAAPAVGAAVKRAGAAVGRASDVAGQAIRTGARAVRPTIRTYMPTLNNAIDAAKVNYDWYAPKAYLAAKNAPKVIKDVVGKVSQTPVAKGLATGSRFVGKVNNALYTGAGGKAFRTANAIMAGSPTGDPNWERAQLAKNQQVNMVIGPYERLMKPGYLDKLSQTPEGQREARLMLMSLEDGMNKANLPQQVKDHIYASLKGGNAMENSDHQSMMGILNKYIAMPSYQNNSAFQGGGMPNIGDLLSVGTLGLNNLVGQVTGNEMLLDKQTLGDMGIAKSQQQRYISNLKDFYTGQVQNGRMSQQDAQLQFNKKIAELR